MTNGTRNILAESRRIQTPYGIHGAFDGFEAMPLTAPVPLDRRKVRLQQNLKFVQRIFSNMIGIRWGHTAALAVRRKYDEHAVWLQHAGQLGDKPAIVCD